MANDIKIIGWTCRGFRSPDHEVELLNQKGEPYHVSLIQMPNGTGKTTETVVFNNLGTTVNWPSVILDTSQPTIFPTLGTSTTNPLVAFLTPAGYNAGTYKYFMYVYTDPFNNIVINIQNPDITFPDMGAFGFTIEIREYI